jgi:hypothetical protein
MRADGLNLQISRQFYIKSLILFDLKIIFLFNINILSMTVDTEDQSIGRKSNSNLIYPTFKCAVIKWEF